MSKSPRKIKVSLHRSPALRVSKVSIGKEKICYLLVADKKIKYEIGRSRIVYIGTTRRGLNRISQSVAKRADDVLAIHGVTEFKARVVSCKPRQNVKTWLKLERAMLIRFKELFGEIPYCNSHGSKMKRTDEFSYFTESRIATILEDSG